MNSGLFVRDDETIETLSKEAYNKLQAKFHNDEISAFQWGVELVTTALEHGLVHNSHAYPEFYQELVEAITDQIQTATTRDITLASMMGYLDKIELDGFYPLVSFRPGIMQNALMDMEPTFMVYGKDEKLLPVSQPMFRFSVSSYGVLHFQLFDHAWLNKGQTEAVIQNTASTAKPKAKKVAGKKTAKAKG